ncbi:MAG: peptide deformylase [Thermodesulfobacteriota bacterium]
MDEIRIYPDPILRKKAQPIKNINGKVKDIADRMADVMYAKRGIGLAAPQIGILSRILIVDLIIHHLSRLKRELLVKRMLKNLKRFKDREPL